MSTDIKTIKSGDETVFVSKLKGLVTLSIYAKNGSMNTMMKVDTAQELINALEEMLEIVKAE